MISEIRNPKPEVRTVEADASSFALGCVIGHRPSATGHRPSAVCHSPLAIGSRPSAIGYRLSAIPATTPEGNA